MKYYRRGRGRYKRIKPISIKGFTKEFLILLAQGGGVIALSSFAGPRAPKFLAKFGKYAYWRFSGLIKRLERQHYLERQKRGREELIKITDQGKQRAALYALQKFKLEKPVGWDGKWRIILFDVPEEAKPRRDFLRRIFRDHNLYQLQKSVFVTPYPCRNLYELACEAIGLQRCVHFIEISDLGTCQNEVAKHFSELRRF